MAKINLRLLDFYIDSIVDMNLNNKDSNFVELFCKKFKYNGKQKALLTEFAKKISENLENIDFNAKNEFNLNQFNKEEESIEDIDIFPNIFINTFITEGIDMNRRVIYFDSPIIDENSAEMFIKKIYMLESQSSETITIFFNSRGGDTYSGLAIMDTIKSCSSPINMIVFGRCMSMGAWILQSATTRIISQNARFMIHKGQIGLGVMHPEDNKAWVAQYNEDEVLFNHILLDSITKKYKNKTLNKLKEFLVAHNPDQENQIKGINDGVEAINKLIEFDLILDAEETIDLGLADKIFKSMKELN